MNALLLAFSILVNFITASIIRNQFCKNDVKSSADLYIFNTVSSVFSMITLAVIAVIKSGGIPMPSTYTILLGVIFGIITSLCSIFNMKALETGPLSYTTVIISCSMLIPALSGMVLYGENISAWQYVGAAFMIFSFICAIDKKNDKLGASVKWFILCMVTFFCNGGIGIMQKIHQNSEFKGELDAFLIIAFAISTVFSAAMIFYCKGVKKEKVSVLAKEKRSKFVIYGVVSGIGIAFCNIVNLFLSGAMDAIIFFPVVNGVNMLLSTLAGIILWHEKLSKKQWVGIIVGMAAVILLCNIF